MMTVEPRPSDEHDHDPTIPQRFFDGFAEIEPRIDGFEVAKHALSAEFSDQAIVKPTGMPRRIFTAVGEKDRPHFVRKRSRFANRLNTCSLAPRSPGAQHHR